MKHVVIGAGQVGRAIAEVIGATLRDIGDPVVPADALHICFPWSEAFHHQVRAYLTSYRPRHLVIHSTVPVGTSRALGAVHSPVTGRHPDLAQSVRTFVKVFGGPEAPVIAAMFAAAGCRTEVYPAQETTEAGKLWATLQFGWLIALQKEARRFCAARGADPEVAYRRFNEIYNEGYDALGEPWVLPVLRDVPGPIGGHCVVPNLALTPTRIAAVLGELDREWAA